jgi:hypothetical protein
MQQYFPCHRCGTHNLVGAVSCRNCHQQLFYNCPHCHAWVDNRYSHCPQCRHSLSWPRDVGPQNTYGQTWYVPQANYVEHKKGNPLPAVLVSLFIIGVIALIFVNPGSSSATKNYATAPTTSTVPVTGATITQSGNQPQITLSGPSAPSSPAPSTSTPTQSAPASQSSSAAYMPSGVTLTTSSGEIIEIQMSPATGSGSSTNSGAYTNLTSSGSSTVKRSAYLDQLWPTWGHCTKGSCQAITQQ